MKNNCNIIRDILPLYIENMISDDTRAFVDEHIAECAECREELKQMQTPTEFIADTNAAPLKNLKKKLLIKKVQTIILTAALALAIVLSVVSVLTAPQYFLYSDNLISISENTDGDVAIAFDDAVSGYTCLKEIGTATGIEVYRISAWNTAWDLHFTQRGAQNMIISSEKPIAVYFVQNNDVEDVFIYGTKPNPTETTQTLPRLILGQYFALALFAALALGVIMFVYRKKETAKVWIERVFYLPVSYVLAHLFTKGIAMQSYSTQRDFSLIVLVAILIYCVLLFGVSLYRQKKENRENK